MSPENETADKVLASLAECARAHAPDVRIVGNLRAGDIVAAVETTRATMRCRCCSSCRPCQDAFGDKCCGCWCEHQSGCDWEIER